MRNIKETRRMRRLKEKRKFRRNIVNKLILLMVPIFLMGILTTADIINAEGRIVIEDKGDMNISKTATATENQREFEIELRVKPKGNEEKKPIDVVMVVDTSGSMNRTINGVPRIDIIKEEIEDFYRKTVEQNPNSDIRFSLICFDGLLPPTKKPEPQGTKASIVAKWDDDFLTALSTLETGYNILSDDKNANSADAATNTQIGIRRVKELLRGKDYLGNTFEGLRPNAIPYVILFTDGVPNGNNSHDTITSWGFDNGCWLSSTKDLNGNNIEGYENLSLPRTQEEARKLLYRINSADAAYREYKGLLEEFKSNNIQFVTIGLSEGISDNTIVANVTSIYNIYGKDFNDTILSKNFVPYMQNVFEFTSADDYPYYIDEDDGDVHDEIKKAFNDIRLNIIEKTNIKATNMVIEDIVTSDFEIVPGSLKAYAIGKDGEEDRLLKDNEYTSEIDYDNNKVKCTFDIVEAEGVYIKFKVKPVNEYFGGSNIDTNVEATVDYTNPEGEEKQQTFEKPKVDLDFIEGSISIVKKIEGAVPSTFDETTFPVNITGGVVNKKLAVNLKPNFGENIESDTIEKFEFTLIDENTRIIDTNRNYLYVGEYTINELVPMNYELVNISVKNQFNNDFTSDGFVRTDKFTINKDNPNVGIIVTNKVKNDKYFYDRDDKTNEFGILVKPEETNNEGNN